METIGNIFNLFTQAMDTSFLDIRNVGIDLLFLSVFTVAACYILGFLIQKLCKRKTYKYIFILICGNVSVCVEYIMRNLPSCVLRVREILDNVRYIMSYESNNRSFLAALGLTSDYSLKIDQVVYYMNSSEWKKAESGTGYMNWYMKGIHRSLDKTVRMFGYHLGRPGSEQGRYFFIIAILAGIFISAVLYKVFFLHIEKKLWRCFLTIAVCAGSIVFCEIFCFGTVLYLVSALIVFLLLCYSFFSIADLFRNR